MTAHDIREYDEKLSERLFQLLDTELTHSYCRDREAHMREQLADARDRFARVEALLRAVDMEPNSRGMVDVDEVRATLTAKGEPS